jgi:RNA polymerase sigma-70 factor, ECF subfamily
MTDLSQTDRDRQFTQQLQQHYRRLYGYIFTLLRNHQDAQDVFQQTSLVLWEKFDEYQPDTNFVTWACTVARFKALDFQKQQRRYRVHFSEAFQLRLSEVHAGIPADEFHDRGVALEQCIEKLPPDQRDLLRECFAGDRSVSSVATERGRTRHSVYSSLRNIRKKLLECVNASASEDREP